MCFVLLSLLSHYEDAEHKALMNIMHIRPYFLL